MERKLEIFRDPVTGYPDVQKMLVQFDSWAPEERFMNQFWRLNNLYKIVDKNQRIVTFVMKPEQADLYCDPHPRHVILKARQLGFSTLIQLKFLDKALFNSNESIFVIAQDKDAASRIMNTKIKFAYEQLDPALKKERPLLKSNAEEFVIGNPAGNSSINVSVSARSATASGVHSSEMAKSYTKDPEKTEEFFTGTLPAATQNADVYIESTAEGAVGSFYRVYNESFDEPKSPEAFKRHFYAWFHSPEYESDFEPEGGFDSDMRRYFTELEEKHGIRLTAKKKNWYASQEKVLKFKMKQEYPSTPEEAFSMSSEGRIWGRQLSIVRNTGRFKRVPYMPSHPAYAIFDIGYNDLAACWCLQYIEEEWRCFGYLEVRKGDMAWFFEKFEAYGWRFKIVFLPHDSANKKFGGAQSLSLVDEIENWGYRIIVIPRSENRLADIFNAGKFILRCVFNNDPNSGVPDGFVRLENYRFRKTPEGSFSKEPVHDENSNGADAFRGASVVSQIIALEQGSEELESFTDQFESTGGAGADQMTGY